MKKITKKQVDDAYKKPINPLKPFERLELLLGFGIQELEEMKNPKKECPDCGGEMEQVSECCGASIDSDILICSDCKEHSDIAVCETCNGEGVV